MSTKSERGISRGARRTEAVAEFEHFVGEVSARLLKSAYLIVWDLGEAEDLVQDALARVARRWASVREMDHRESYVRKVMVNLALDGGKRRSRRWDELGEQDDSALHLVDLDAQESVERVVDASALITLLESLAPRQRAVIVLRYFDDMSEAQISEVLGCSIGTVKSTTSHALARLRSSARAQTEQDELFPSGHKE